MEKFINFLCFQAGWFAVAYLGGSGQGVLGTVIMFLLASVSLAFTKSKARKFAYMLLAVVIGTVFDSLFLNGNFYSFKSSPTLPWSYPIWMSAMWYGFASTVDLSLAWLRGRWGLLVLFGFFGGPASYYAGTKFGELYFTSSSIVSLLMVGVFWAFITPLLFFIAEKMGLFGEGVNE